MSMHPDEAHYSAAHLPDHVAAPTLELQTWRRGFRNSSPDSMAPIAKRLDDQQIAAVAAYYQQVRSSKRRRDHEVTG